MSISALGLSPAAAGTPDEDRTPVTQCDNLPSTAVFSTSETAAVCKEMLRILEGVTISDLRSFSKVTFLLSAKGYETDDYSQIARELVDIIRLRVRSWIAFNGIVGPRDAGDIACSGAAGCENTVVVMKEQHQSGRLMAIFGLRRPVAQDGRRELFSKRLKAPKQ